MIALTYGVALLCHTYGFLAVFAAGLALRQIDAPSHRPADAPLPSAMVEMPVNMMQAVQRFNAQLERFAEVGIVLATGAMLAVIEWRSEMLWFIPVFFLIVRPMAVYVGLLGTRVETTQRRLIAWFGIRGIGSIYYLMYAITHGLEPTLAQQMLSITLSVVVASVIAHGISVTPLMKHYEDRKAARRRSTF